MSGNRFAHVRLLPAVLLCLGLFLTGCGLDRELYLPETSVAVLPGEDLAAPCTYALRLTQGPVLVPGQPPQQVPQTGVLVVFERSDSMTLFDDPQLIAAAQSLHMAMLYAFQCNAKSFNDLQPNAFAGPGRALFQALDQYATSLNHPELATANVFLTGFSAGAYLSMTTASEFPQRVLGTVLYAPGSAYATNLEYVPVPPALAKIPSLILVSAHDVAAGDQLPFFWFQHGRAQGAPWGFGSQEVLGHCCVDSIAPVLIPWMTAVFNGYTRPSPTGQVALAAPPTPVAPTVAFQVAIDGSFDPVGWQDFNIGSYSVLPSTAGGPFQGWLPDDATTQAWITWITNPDGNN